MAEYAILTVDGDYKGIGLRIDSLDDAVRAYEIRKLICSVETSYTSSKRFVVNPDSRVDLVFTDNVEEPTHTHTPHSDADTDEE